MSGMHGATRENKSLVRCKHPGRGKRLLGFAYKEILAESIAVTIEKGIVDAAGSTIANASTAELVGKSSKKVAARGGADLLSPQRTVVIKYRGIDVPMLVSSFHREVELRVAAAVKSSAVHKLKATGSDVRGSARRQAGEAGLRCCF